MSFSGINRLNRGTQLQFAKLAPEWEPMDLKVFQVYSVLPQLKMGDSLHEVCFEGLAFHGHFIDSTNYAEHGSI